MRAHVSAVLGLLLLASCRSAVPDSNGASARAQQSPHAGEVQSNILRHDYAGSAACARCHEREYAAWLDSPMHRMTRDLRQTQIAAPFTGESFSFRGDSVRLETMHNERFMRLSSTGGSETLFRVSKVIGGRYREDFVGSEVDPSAPFGTARDVERVLPVSYLVWSREWRYKGYSVMVRERSELSPGVVWKTGCLFCHNSAPSLSLLLDDVYGVNAHSYQGSASIELPDGKRPRYVVADARKLNAALGDELNFLGKKRDLSGYDAKRALTAAIDTTRSEFDEDKLVELGIGCEACHGGAREHVEDPTRVRPTFALRSDFLRVTTATGSEPTHAQDINRACDKCHTVLFSRYPYTWEGRTRRDDPGGSSINSGEARDFLLGDCNSQLSCVNCHDPHAEDSKSALSALEGSKGDDLCSSCHSELQPQEARRAHTHHAADSAGSHCLNCHMPQKNMGLAYNLTRYHRIGSPTDRERVEGDRPLECALCHSDKSVDQLVTTMERLWGKSYDRAALRRLYGPDLRVNAVEATLRSGKPHEKGTALGIAGRERRKEWQSLVVLELGNDYPLVRYFARHALEEITGAAIPLDLDQPGTEVVQRVQEYLKLATVPGPAPPSASQLEAKP